MPDTKLDPTTVQATPPPAPAQRKSLRDLLLSGGPWPLVALLVAGAASFTSIALWAPEDVRMGLFGAHGVLFTLLAWLARSPLT